MPHVEHLVHFTPIRTAFFGNRLEQRRHGEHVVFDHPAILTYEVKYLGLCPACAVYHAVDVRTHLV